MTHTLACYMFSLPETSIVCIFFWRQQSESNKFPTCFSPPAPKVTTAWSCRKDRNSYATHILKVGYPHQTSMSWTLLWSWPARFLAPHQPPSPWKLFWKTAVLQGLFLALKLRINYANSMTHHWITKFEVLAKPCACSTTYIIYIKLQLTFFTCIF